MEEVNFAVLITSIMLWSTSVVGAASLIVQGIALITGITPTTLDDEIVTKVQTVLAKVQSTLNGVALNNVPAKK